MPLPRLIPACLLALALSGCRVDMKDFQRDPVLDPVVLDGPRPPPVASPEGERLYQLLYAGELGTQAATLGQQARMLAWLDAMELDEDQLAGLVRLLDRLDAARDEQALLRAIIDARELERLGPIYERISAAYAGGAHPSQAELSALAVELEAARKELYGGRDPRVWQLEQVATMVELVKPWLGSLSEDQHEVLADSRFFLRRRLGPLLNPGDYGDLTGISWDGGDFRGVNTTLRDDDEHHMDIGGLWSTEFMRAPPKLYLQGLQLQALILMALQEPGLREAIALRRAPPTVPASPRAPTTAP